MGLLALTILVGCVNRPQPDVRWEHREGSPDISWDPLQGILTANLDGFLTASDSSQPYFMAGIYASLCSATEELPRGTRLDVFERTLENDPSNRLSQEFKFTLTAEMGAAEEYAVATLAKDLGALHEHQTCHGGTTGP